MPKAKKAEPPVKCAWCGKAVSFTRLPTHLSTCAAYLKERKGEK